MIETAIDGARDQLTAGQGRRQERRGEITREREQVAKRTNRLLEALADGFGAREEMVRKLNEECRRRDALTTELERCPALTPVFDRAPTGSPASRSPPRPDR